MAAWRKSETLEQTKFIRCLHRKISCVVNNRSRLDAYEFNFVPLGDFIIAPKVTQRMTCSIQLMCPLELHIPQAPMMGSNGYESRPRLWPPGPNADSVTTTNTIRNRVSLTRYR